MNAVAEVETVSKGSRRKTEIREKLWEDANGSARAQMKSGLLVISVFGKCDYKRMVDLACHAGRMWQTGNPEVAIDFSDCSSADCDGVRFLISQLHGIGSRCAGNVFLVRAPWEARVFLKQLWGGANIHFAVTVQHAVLKSKQLARASKIKPGRPFGFGWGS